MWADPLMLKFFEIFDFRFERFLRIRMRNLFSYIEREKVSPDKLILLIKNSALELPVDDESDGKNFIITMQHSNDDESPTIQPTNRCEKRVCLAEWNGKHRKKKWKRNGKPGLIFLITELCHDMHTTRAQQGTNRETKLYSSSSKHRKLLKKKIFVTICSDKQRRAVNMCLRT